MSSTRSLPQTFHNVRSIQVPVITTMEMNIFWLGSLITQRINNLITWENSKALTWNTWWLLQLLQQEESPQRQPTCSHSFYLLIESQGCIAETVDTEPSKGCQKPYDMQTLSYSNIFVTFIRNGTGHPLGKHLKPESFIHIQQPQRPIRMNMEYFLL